MNYISTRGARTANFTSAYAIKQGLASDGGLFMPETLPTFTQEDLKSLCAMSYPQRAAAILSRYLTDYTYEELLTDCTASYSAERFPGGAAPITAVGDQIRVLELWHGPTCAFKDMALQIMPRLLSRALSKTGEERTAFILVATSGDTGKAALEGYRDVDRVKIMVYYPVNGVSRMQKLQMATQEGQNVYVCSVKGNFDDAQNGVKQIFSDRDTAARLSQNGYFLSSANSINWGRLAPQIVYYVSAYCDMVNRGDIKMGETIDVAVPTGNFGNIFAGYLARCAGLPIGKMVCASNRNNILTDFFESGTYDRNRSFYTTMSPSMDILISSNLERMLYLTVGSEETAYYMQQLAQTGRYTVSRETHNRLCEVFTGKCSDEAETARTIRATFEAHHYLIDPHTAVGLSCAQRHAAENGGRKVLSLSTASPYKFASSVCRALTDRASEDEFTNLETLAAYTNTVIPAPLRSLAGKEIRFDPEAAIEADQMEDGVFRALHIC